MQAIVEYLFKDTISTLESKASKATYILKEIL